MITAGRIFARYCHEVTHLGWDDALAVIAAAGTATWLAIAMIMTSTGLGQHIYNITYNNYYFFMRLGSINLILFYTTIGLAQFSMIGFNWRLSWKRKNGLTPVPYDPTQRGGFPIERLPRTRPARDDQVY